MNRSTQLLAYHGRTALLLGPMPRRAIPPVANSAAAIRPLVDVSELARNSTLKSAAGIGHPTHNRLLETTMLSIPARAREEGFALRHKKGAAKSHPSDALCGKA